MDQVKATAAFVANRSSHVVVDSAGPPLTMSHFLFLSFFFIIKENKRIDEYLWCGMQG
jgi:hypothetical protein